MVSIHMKSAGCGEYVVLVPGLGGQASFWSPVMERLSDRFHVSACDHPGVGKSPANGPPSIPSICSAIIGWMDAHGISRIHVVGHSTGSLVAQALALDFKPRVRSVVLSSGWARTDKRFRDLFDLRRHVLETLGGTAYTVLGQLIAFPSEWYGQHLAKVQDLDFSTPSTVDAALTGARIEMLLNYSRIGELCQLEVPTLVVGAEDDYVVPFHHSVELARLIPGARLFKLNGGHFAPITRTIEYVERVVEFWKAAN